MKYKWENNTKYIENPPSNNTTTQSNQNSIAKFPPAAERKFRMSIFVLFSVFVWDMMKYIGKHISIKI